MPLEGGVRFTLREGYPSYYEAGLPRIVLELETEKIYPCANFSIDACSRFAGGALSVDIQGIRLGGPVCFGSMEPASARLFLDLPPGSYAFLLSGASLTDRYAVTVTDSPIVVDSLHTEFTRSEAHAFWRYPRNSFAYLCGTTNETSAICDDFLARLRGAVPLREVRFPATGLAPYPSSSAGHWHDAPARYFVYPDDAAFALAGRTLATYTRDVIAGRQGIGIELLSWKNERHLSWLFEGGR